MAAAVSSLPAAAEANPSAISQAPTERQDLGSITNHPSNAPSHSPQLETLAPLALSPPPFINSIAELKDLSEAIYAFQKSYDDLHNHLDSIKASILSLLPQADAPDVAPPLASSSPEPEVSLPLKKSEGNSPNSELETLCKTMCSRDVRKYLATHLSDLPRLREEVPKALQLAPNPPKLVLECLGKFFLQGSKAFTKDSPMIPAREASILILECFLLMMGINSINENGSGEISIGKSLREDAETAALAWRKRLVAEGGIANANQIDARGLLLFVACFGIPASIKREDFRDMVIAANAKEIVAVLKNSRVLMSKITEILEGMIKNKMEVDAVDIAYTFGLEEKFNPQTILSTFLEEFKESGKKPKKGSQASAASNNDANKKHLAALKSVIQCLERHKIEPEKILPGWQINEKIASLEKEITESDQKSGEKTANKRKVSETEMPKKSKNQEVKRSRYSTHGPHQPKPTGHFDKRRTFPNNRFPSQTKTYSPAPSVAYGGPGAGLPPGFGDSLAASHSFQGGVRIDTAPQLLNRGSHPYLWHGDSAINERYATGQPSSVGLTSLYRGSPSLEGFAGAMPNVSSVRGSTSADIYQFADSVVESSAHPSSIARGAGPTMVPPFLYQA